MRNALEIYKRIEEIAEQIYYMLGQEAVNLGYTDIANILFNMMLDEQHHARELEMAIGIIDYERFELVVLEEGAPFDLLHEIELIQSTLDDKDINLIDIIQTAQVLESKFIAVHATNALKFNSWRLQALFDELSKDDLEHLEELKKLEVLVRNRTH